MKISVLGYGSFGSAISSRLILRGHTIIQDKVIDDTDIVVVSVPSYAVTDTLISWKEKIIGKKIIICSKGFDKTGNLFSVVLNKEFPNNQIYFMYGPTLADELKDGVFSVIILAGDDGKEDIKRQIESDNLKVVLSDDVIGVQVTSALKNTVGIFIGITEGAGLGQNVQGFIFSKGLQEIQKIGMYLGADPNTFIGFAGAGDLFIKSRSRLIGYDIGKGKRIDDIEKDITFPKEGLTALKNILKMENKIGLDLSFFKILNSIIYENLPVKEAIMMISKTI